MTESMVGEVPRSWKSAVPVSVGESWVSCGGGEGVEDLGEGPAWVGGEEEGDGSSGVWAGLLIIQKKGKDKMLCTCKFVKFYAYKEGINR